MSLPEGPNRFDLHHRYGGIRAGLAAATLCDTVATTGEGGAIRIGHILNPPRGSGHKGAMLPVYPLLALLWALVLLPPMVRGRVRHRADLAEFKRIRLCFGPSGSAPKHAADSASSGPVRAIASLRTPAQRRRRVLAVIGIFLAGTLAVALLMRTRVAWGMHLLVYDVLIGYVGLLAHARDRKAGRRPVAAPVLRPVPDYDEPAPRFVPRRHSAPVPALLHAASR